MAYIQFSVESLTVLGAGQWQNLRYKKQTRSILVDTSVSWDFGWRQVHPWEKNRVLSVQIKLSACSAGLWVLKKSPSKYCFVGFPATRYLSAHLNRRKQTNTKAIITEFPNWWKSEGSIFFCRREKGIKKHTTHKGQEIKIALNSSAITLEARIQWENVLKIQKEKNFQLRILC